MTSESAPISARALARAEMTAQILRAARRQLESAGPGELSLRAIARELGMASSAIYRYFTSRDELLTALLVQIYNELGDVLEAADHGVRPRHNLGRRFTVMAGALRTWAVAHPHDWALLFGSPVPGYRAPEDTIGPAGRVTGAFISILVAMTDQDVPRRVRGPKLSRAAARSVDDLLNQLDPGTRQAIDADLLQRGMMAWTVVVGTISLELFGHLHRAVSDYPAYFDQIVARAVHDLDLA